MIFGARRSRILCLVLTCALALTFSPNLLAQSTGTLWGRVSDPNGAVIPDVLVTLRNRNIGYERSTQTDQDGLYRIIGLAAGTYRMEVQATGFRTQAVDEIAIDIGRTTVQDFHLEALTLWLMAESFNILNVANLTGYSNVLNQPNYGQPSARVGQVFGTGGPRAFQFGTRLTF